jgi:hypothetical protein
MAKTMSPGRVSLMNILLAVGLAMRNRLVDSVPADDT